MAPLSAMAKMRIIDDTRRRGYGEALAVKFTEKEKMATYFWLEYVEGNFKEWEEKRLKGLKGAARKEHQGKDFFEHYEEKHFEKYLNDIQCYHNDLENGKTPAANGLTYVGKVEEKHIANKKVEASVVHQSGLFWSSESTKLEKSPLVFIGEYEGIFSIQKKCSTYTLRS